MTGTSSLAERVDRVRDRVADAAARSGRKPDAVTIVAVSKTADRSAIDEAYALGLRHFGENRVQAAQAKFARPLPPDATLHMIGQLQTNKAKFAAQLFGVIDSVDRASLIAALEKEAGRLGAQLPVLLQVNVAQEPQKAGCEPAAAHELASLIREAPHLALRGLMAMAPLVPEAEGARPVFRALRELRDQLIAADPALNLRVLSMGMSDDYHVAIEEGATEVRIGRAIFG